MRVISFLLALTCASAFHAAPRHSMPRAAKVLRMSASPEQVSRRDVVGALGTAAATASLWPAAANAAPQVLSEVTSDSGLKILTLKEGEGAQPAPGQTVKVRQVKGLMKGKA